MPAAPGRKKDYALTPEAFGQFLEWLSPDHEQAAQEYLEMRNKLVRFFICKGCAHSEELADGALDRVALIVSKEPEKYDNRMALCYGVAKNVWLEYIREITPDELNPDEIAAQDCDGPAFGEQEERCLASCLDKLPGDERVLIKQYHHARGRKKIEIRKRLADERGGLNKLRIDAYRIRRKLHRCITGCVRRQSVES